MIASSAGLLPDMFAVDGHRFIWMAMAYLVNKGEELDPISITNVYTDEKAKEAIDELGGLDYIEAMKSTPVASNTAMFVGHIMQASARRAVYEQAKRIQQEAVKNDEADLNEYLGGVEAGFRDISIDYQVASEVKKIGDDIGDRLKDRLLKPKDVIGLKTGWRNFDLATQGLKAGELTIVGARSKTGKSVTLLNWCNKISVDDGLPVLYIDTEMFTEEQEDRLLAMRSGVPEAEIKNGMFGKDTVNGTARDKIAKVQKASKDLKSAPFYHVYLPHFTPEKVMALARKYQLQHGVQMVVFDYIKLPSSDSHGAEKEYQKLGYLTSTLKDLAGLLQVPVITAVQLNRTGANQIKEGGEPDETAIAGSDRILQLANRLCFLWWMDEEDRAISTGGANQKFKIAFQRGGASNMTSFNIRFKGEILRQEEVS
jgi:replicative DNA helicase